MSDNSVLIVDDTPENISVLGAVLKDYKKLGSFTKIDSLNYKLNSLMVWPKCLFITSNFKIAF